MPTHMRPLPPLTSPTPNGLWLWPQGGEGLAVKSAQAVPVPAAVMQQLQLGPPAGEAKEGQQQQRGQEEGSEAPRERKQRVDVVLYVNGQVRGVARGVVEGAFGVARGLRHRASQQGLLLLLGFKVGRWGAAVCGCG